MLGAENKNFGSSRTIDVCGAGGPLGDELGNECVNDAAAERRSFLSLNELGPPKNRSYADLETASIQPSEMGAATDASIKDEYMKPTGMFSSGYGCNEYNQKSSEVEKKKPGIRTYMDKIQKFRKYTDCVFVRLFYIGVSVFRLSVASCIYDETLLGVLYVSSFIIIVDMIYSLLKRDGLDYYWFSISTALFSVMMTTIIIMLNEFKFETHDFTCSTNRTMLENYKNCTYAHMSFTTCSLTEIFTVTFIMGLVFTRWIMPVSKKINPEAIYHQIYSYTSTAADIIDIADYMQSERFSSYPSLIRGIEFVFCISLIQFSFSLTAVKERNMKLKGFAKLIDIVLATEAWSLVLALFSQVLPCLIIRICILIIVKTKIHLSLYFFTFKNGVMMFLIIYRIVVVVYRKYKEERERPLNAIMKMANGHKH